MLSFYCTDGKETIACPDSEGPDQVFDRLDKHTEECALATLTFQGNEQTLPGREPTIYAQLTVGILVNVMFLGLPLCHHSETNKKSETKCKIQS